MSGSELLYTIERWCTEEDWLSIEQQVTGPTGNPLLVLSVCPPDTPRRAGFLTEAIYMVDAGRLLIRQRAILPPELSHGTEEDGDLEAGLDRILAYLIDRPGVLVPEMTEAEGGPAMELTLTLWAEGLGKHTFLSALVDLDKTRERVEGMFRELVVGTRGVPAAATVEAAPPPPSVDPVKEFCTACGAQLKPEARFCQSCGEPVK
jgi:hypothetical protein